MTLGKISADCVAPLGSMQLRREVLRYCGAIGVRARVVFRAMLCSGTCSVSFFLYPWQLPKVLILQSASARAGADRTFSDQYLGELLGGEKEYMEREPLNAESCAYLTWCFERDRSSEWCVIGTESLLTANGTQGVERIGCCTENALKRGDGAVFSVHFSKSGARPRADVNRDRWIQSPEC